MSDASARIDSAEAADGRLGAVLSAPRSGLVSLGPDGPWLAASPATAKRVLTEPGSFDFPGDVTRSGDLSGSAGETRSGHLVFAPLTPDQVARGVDTFTREWPHALARHDEGAPGKPYDAMALLRLPMARATCAAVLTDTSEAQRNTVAGLVLDWIDALAPVIAAARPPARWSSSRRREVVARRRLEQALALIPGRSDSVQMVAAMLAAGIQVPIAAGAWLLAWLAAAPVQPADPAHAVWETLRLTPPTWVTARIATRDVELDGHVVDAGSLVLVSPLLLGRMDSLVPGSGSALSEFDPERWDSAQARPGAWLPFGAGPHACPGRTLGTALLHELAQWATLHQLRLTAHVGIDQSRGIAPHPCQFIADLRQEPTP